MSYKFKKVMDLELTPEVPEGANVLIETDGATMRLPSTAINNGYSKEECDEKFMTNTDIASEDDLLEWLSDADIVEPAAASNGKLFTDNNNKIYVL